MKTEKDYLDYLEEIRRSAYSMGFETLDREFEEHLRCRFFGEDVVIRQTERLFLRELKTSDLDEMYCFCDAGNETVLNAFLKESREESRRFLESYIGHMYPMYEFGIWAVVKKDGGKLIGLCGLGNTEVHGERCSDLGYYIRPEERGRGYALEAAKAALDYAGNYLGLASLYAVIKRENVKSENILRKLGFLETGLPEDEAEGERIFEKKLSV